MASDETAIPTARQPSQPAMAGTTSPLALQPPATTATTTVNRDRRAASSSPTWLRPNHPALARSARSPLVPPTVNGRPPLANRERPGASIGTAMWPRQHDPNTSQHESEPLAVAYPVVTPPAPPLASLEPSVAGATKRKAPMEALGRDDRQDWCLRRDDAKGVYRRGAGGTGAQASGGGIIQISEEEGKRIMMGARPMKNPARRVTTLGGETHGKRTRRAATTSDDGESSLSSLRRRMPGL